jgi:hypothetical protein
VHYFDAFYIFTTKVSKSWLGMHRNSAAKFPNFPVSRVRGFGRMGWENTSVYDRYVSLCHATNFLTSTFA